MLRTTSDILKSIREKQLDDFEIHLDPSLHEELIYRGFFSLTKNGQVSTPSDSIYDFASNKPSVPLTMAPPPPPTEKPPALLNLNHPAFIAPQPQPLVSILSQSGMSIFLKITTQHHEPEPKREPEPESELEPDPQSSQQKSTRSGSRY